MSMPFILSEFGFDESRVVVNGFGSGLINNTWMVTNEVSKYILQRINQNVFTEPQLIADNIEHIGDYLSVKYPNYMFTRPLRTKDDKPMLYIEGEGYFRMFLFVEGSHSKDVVETPEQAFEAATQFGRFTNLLQNFDVSTLNTTIPDFHNLSLRYQQFLHSLENGNADRIQESSTLIDVLKNHVDIVTTYESITSSAEFKIRVTHHDTKISNVLFDDDSKGLCVIDLDTVMPGYFISDVGDMMRTYLSPVSEEEQDFSKIEIRDEFYKAVVQGYYTEMKGSLTEMESNYFFYAGTFIIYMQALRFLTDYLNDDAYYGSKYPGHNFVRANNQIVLLQQLIAKRANLENFLKN